MTLEGRWENIKPTIMSNTLKTAIKFCGLNLVFEANYVSDQYLCAVGDMLLLCAGVNSDIINLIFRCHSIEIIRYLHIQAEPFMRNFSSLMLAYGH